MTAAYVEHTEASTWNKMHTPKQLVPGSHSSVTFNQSQKDMEMKQVAVLWEELIT